MSRISTSLIGWLVKNNAPITSYLIRKSVFKHFCGGETKQECSPVIKKLYQHGVQSVLDYAVEGQSEGEDFDRIYQEMLENIDFSKNHVGVPFIVFKPTGLGSMDIYEKIAKKSELTEIEQLAWKLVKVRFEGICQKAFEQNVLVLIDAEESWIQDAADELAETMMRRYNRKQCFIFNTLQMYRWGRLDYLKKAHERALEGQYYIGYKLVRGAYMEKERSRAKDMGYNDPIQIDKAATDHDYNEALCYIIKHNDRIAVFVGTHNEESCRLLKDLTEENKIERNNSHIWLGQLYGMSDNISFTLGQLGYNVAKYLPYGPLKEAIPYLIRRAQENTSVAGQTGRELILIEQEVKRRSQSLK
ncbi:MAG: proline dehydrogenase family protein [Flavobacteriales bacterium Tduv]